MTDNEILILKPLCPMKDYSNKAFAVRFYVKEQLKRGKVVTIPFGWEVVTKPSNVEVAEVLENPEEEPTPWDLGSINNNYSPFDSQEKERFLFCTECGIIIKHYDPMYQYCPYCGKRHYFEEVKDESKSHL